MRFKVKLLILFTVFVFKSSFAFDYPVKIRWNAFEGSKYTFSISKVIDARLSKEKSIGSLLSGWYKKKTVGNDSLASELTAFFKTKRPAFDTSTKIILVINQLNIRYLKGYSMGGKSEGCENAISLDYYKITDNTCSLYYQQYFRHKEDIQEYEMGFAINQTFSETLRFAFNDFENQLKKYKPFSLEEIDLVTLYKSFNKKPDQVVNIRNIKDGIYLSCRDFYLNQPALLSSYILSDSLNIGRKSITISSNNGVIQNAYAIVRSKKIFIYDINNKYQPCQLDDNGQLYFLKASDLDDENISKFLIDLETGLAYK